MAAKVLAITALLAGCGESGSTPPDSSTPDDSAPRNDVPLDAAPVSACAAPTGAPITGITLMDGWSDLRALSPAATVVGGWQDSLSSSPDGRRLLFGYDKLDFSAFYISMGTNLPRTGPDLAGVSLNAFKIFQADLGQTDWVITPHPIIQLTGDAAVASPSENEARDLLVFTEFTGSDGFSQLWYSSKATGSWSAPEHLVFNSTCKDDNAKIYGSLSTHVDIVFESDRGDDAGTGDTCGQRTIYTTTYDGGTNSFSAVTKVPGIATATSDDSQPFLTPDGNTMFFSSIRDGNYGVYTATKGVSGTFGDIHPVALATTQPPFVGKVVLIGQATTVAQPDCDLLYMMCGIAEDKAGGMTYGDADHITLEPCVARRPH